jgi:membrane-associated phospholipid phosphatase
MESLGLPERSVFLIHRLFHASLIVLLTASCGTLPNGRRWGEDVTLLPGTERVENAASNAVRDPATWIPAIGAVAFSIGNFDQRVSNWASEKTPIFGSTDRAGKASDTMDSAAGAGVFLTALVTPSGSDPGDWIISKAKGISVEYAALAATGGTTQLLKGWVSRERPDKSDKNSFPSSHSSHTFASAMLDERNVESLPISTPEKWMLDTAFYSLAVGTAWARVEAEKHYPSDVLAGAALGSLISAFVHDTFMGLDQGTDMALSIWPGQAVLILRIEW